MPAKLANTRSLLGRAVGVVGVAAFAAAIAPMAMASADDEALPGAPIVRTSSPGVVNAGPSEVRAADRGVVSGGVSANTNGGGLVKDGNANTPAGLPNKVGGGAVCYNVTGAHGHAQWLGDGSGYDSVISC